jgi:hypothetical protein
MSQLFDKYQSFFVLLENFLGKEARYIMRETFLRNHLDTHLKATVAPLPLPFSSSLFSLAPFYAGKKTVLLKKQPPRDTRHFMR